MCTFLFKVDRMIYRIQNFLKGMAHFVILSEKMDSFVFCQKKWTILTLIGWWTPYVNMASILLYNTYVCEQTALHMSPKKVPMPMIDILTMIIEKASLQSYSIHYLFAWFHLPSLVYPDRSFKNVTEGHSKGRDIETLIITMKCCWSTLRILYIWWEK